MIEENNGNGALANFIGFSSESWEIRKRDKKEAAVVEAGVVAITSSIGGGMLVGNAIKNFKNGNMVVPCVQALVGIGLLGLSLDSIYEIRDTFK